MYSDPGYSGALLCSPQMMPSDRADFTGGHSWSIRFLEHTPMTGSARVTMAELASLCQARLNRAVARGRSFFSANTGKVPHPRSGSLLRLPCLPCGGRLHYYAGQTAVVHQSPSTPSNSNASLDFAHHQNFTTTPISKPYSHPLHCPVSVRPKRLPLNGGSQTALDSPALPAAHSLYRPPLPLQASFPTLHIRRP
jgi:hypothetical protein